MNDRQKRWRNDTSEAEAELTYPDGRVVTKQKRSE